MIGDCDRLDHLGLDRRGWWGDGSDRLESSLTTYEGEWRGGKHNGHGTKDWGDGLRYVGEFVDGRMHGEGSYTLEDGYVMEGRFEHDEFVG